VFEHVMSLRSLLLASVLLSLPGSGLAKDVETIQGTVEVVDGDSLRLGERSLRLFGIDAPERGQRCLDASGSSWDCGAAATARMRELVDGGVICALGGKDVYDRDLVVCASLRTRIEVNASIVEDGFALAYRHYSEEYVAQEDIARVAKAGMWAGTFVAPWDHRAAKRSAKTSKPSSPPPSAACRIKGNISRNGRIYHRPGGQDYDRTRIDTSKGERWFCSAAEAVAAGWRASMR
jgi:endonuclease YncB( thermonuclease family)